VKRIATDKGYVWHELEAYLRKKGIQPQIPRKKNAGPKLGRPVQKTSPRFQVERTFSWMQRKFGRITVRWERIPQCFEAFLSLAITVLWLQRLLG